jgi:GNAT superfamily N-acetyltransferase
MHGPACIDCAIHDDATIDRACYRRAVNIGYLARARLAEAEAVLAESCAYDSASVVADEKLFGPGPTSAAQAFGAWEGNDLVGVAAVSSRWLRVLAVRPGARNRGVGTALLSACETAARADAQSRLSVLDQPGNYLAPGVDLRNVDTISWLERRGFLRGGELRNNVLINVRGNERVTAARAAESAELAASRGYEVRRARVAERQPLLDAIAGGFGGAWPYEVERALNHKPVAVHVAVKDGMYCAFAAHDGNNRGLGWFGPTGTLPAHRSQGLGEALLLACLVDVGAKHEQCEVAWIGPRPFYDKVAGVAADRHFMTFSKTFQ